MRTKGFAAPLLGVWLLTSPVHADTPLRGTLAESLFAEAKNAERAGNDELACSKYAESHRVDPAGGTVLALALCHERLKRYASAWSEFKEAIAFARRDGRPDRERIARAHAAEMEKIAPRVQIEVSPEVAGTPELTVSLDGLALGAHAWNTELPLDPGEHELTASAPGFETWQRTVPIEIGAATTVVTVPELSPAPAEKVEPVVVHQSPAARTRKTVPPLARSQLAPVKHRERKPEGPPPLAYALLGGGGALLGVGGYFGVRALVKANDVCDEPVCPADQEGAYRDYVFAANAATVTITLGLIAGALGGAWLVLSGNDSTTATAGRRAPSDRHLSLEGRLLPKGGALSVRSRF